MKRKGIIYLNSQARFIPLYQTNMQFEFDPGESERNLQKHGIGFKAEQAL